jgi:hypothetical protein
MFFLLVQAFEIYLHMAVIDSHQTMLEELS